MKLATWTALFLLVTLAWPRQVIDTARVAERAPRSRQLTLHSRITTEEAATIPQAPGVIQTNLLDASNVVWFVTADRLPQGSEITAFLIFPDGTEIPMDTLRLNDDVAAGSSFDLPNIRKFGSFWPQGLLTYGVEVYINGRISQTAADFPVGSFRDYDNMSNMVPRIATYREGLSDRDVLLTVSGMFTNDAPYVLIEDLPVPPSAVRASSAEIVVNLSKVPGLDLGLFQELLLTVGQSGWCDTAVFRHTPARSGSYNPAPMTAPGFQRSDSK